jgi:mono/diheme cytochrome c family protein
MSIELHFILSRQRGGAASGFGLLVCRTFREQVAGGAYPFRGLAFASSATRKIRQSEQDWQRAKTALAALELPINFLQGETMTSCFRSKAKFLPSFLQGIRKRGRPMSLIGLFSLLGFATALLGMGCSSETQKSGSVEIAQPPAAEPVVAKAAPSLPQGPGGTMAESQYLYFTHCASCHGRDGKGNGPGLAGLETSPRDFTDKVYMKVRDRFMMRKVIVDGGESVGMSPLMAAWGGILKPEEVEPLLNFILTFSD